MNLPSQLRLAAEIIEKNLPWQTRKVTYPEFMSSDWTDTDMKHAAPIALPRFIGAGYEIRLAPDAGPVPPEGWMIMPDDEKDGRHQGKCLMWDNGKWHSGNINGDHPVYIYAIPIPAQPAAEEGLVDPKELQAGDRYRYRANEQDSWSEETEVDYEDTQTPWQPGEFRPIRTRRPLPAPETRRVPLGPEDVPPGSSIRGAGEDSGWCLITSCSRTGIRIWRHCDPDNQREITWQELFEWNSKLIKPGSTEPHPCSKPEL